MSLEFKSAPAKAEAGDEGTFSALVSVFGNVDKEGDVVESGAFARTLKDRGLPPIYYAHNWELGPIGETLSAEETDAGLKITGKLDADIDPLVGRIHRSMKAGQLREFSFAYEIRDSAEEEKDGKTVRRLKDLELFECGPCLVGMNPATELIEVRAAFFEDAKDDAADAAHDRPDEEPPETRSPEQLELARRRALMLVARPRVVL